MPSPSISPPERSVRPSPGVISEDRTAAGSAAPDFSQRAKLIELMDQPCSYADLQACLHDIAQVNRLTFAYRPTITWLDELLASSFASSDLGSSDPLRVVDVGCGDGDMLRRIHAWAVRRGVPVALTGIDLNPDAIRAAIEATPQDVTIEWTVGDAVSAATVGDVDVILSSLLTHHLTDSQVVQFLRWMERTASRGWFINDLHRQPVPYHLFRFGVRFTNWHRFVKNDGAVSILRSFIVEDWQALCADAGLAASSVSIKEYRPARLCVGRIKQI